MNSDLEQRVRDLLQQNLKLEAIKLYREETGASLIESKTAVEQLDQGAAATTTAPFGNRDDDGENEVLQLLRQGQKIQAISRYRQLHRVGLRDAKAAVEALAERRAISNHSDPPSNEMGGIFLFAFAGAVLITAAAAVAWFMLR